MTSIRLSYFSNYQTPKRNMNYELCVVTAMKMIFGVCNGSLDDSLAVHVIFYILGI